MLLLLYVCICNCVCISCCSCCVVAVAVVLLLLLCCCRNVVVVIAAAAVVLAKRNTKQREKINDKTCDNGTNFFACCSFYNCFFFQCLNECWIFKISIVSMSKLTDVTSSPRVYVSCFGVCCNILCCVFFRCFVSQLTTFFFFFLRETNICLFVELVRHQK